MATAKTATKIQPGQVTDIRHVVRNVGPMSYPELNIYSATEVEEHIKNSYLDEGWELFTVQFISTQKGRDVGAGLGFDPMTWAYILVKRADII